MGWFSPRNEVSVNRGSGVSVVCANRAAEAVRHEEGVFLLTASPSGPSSPVTKLALIAAPVVASYGQPCRCLRTRHEEGVSFTAIPKVRSAP